MTKKENVLEKCRINLDSEKVQHSITRIQRDKLQERINKAIKYIKNKWKKDSYWEDIDNCLKFCDFNEFEYEDILKILKGE